MASLEKGGSCVPLESPLPSCLEEKQPGLGWDLALVQGQFCNKNKTKTRFLVFCSNQLSRALPPK